MTDINADALTLNGVNVSGTESVVRPWWMKYAEGNWIGLSFIPKIIAEANRRQLEEIRGIVEKMKWANDHQREKLPISEHARSDGWSSSLDAVLEKIKEI